MRGFIMHLQPCPFCGEVNITRVNLPQELFYAICTKCGAKMPVEKWNRRANRVDVDKPACNSASAEIAAHMCEAAENIESIDQNEIASMLRDWARQLRTLP